MAVAQPMIAHVLNGGGPLNVALLLLGACFAYGGVRLRERKPNAMTVGRVITYSGIALIGLGLVIDSSPRPTASNATVRIVQPRDGEEVPAGQPIAVAVDLKGASIALSPNDTSGGHLHLYVDGQLQQMPYSTEAQITLDPGTHDIRVEYVDFRHLSFSPEVATVIEVTAG